jgi:hypothetical protein
VVLEQDYFCINLERERDARDARRRETRIQQKKKSATTRCSVNIIRRAIYSLVIQQT